MLWPFCMQLKVLCYGTVIATFFVDGILRSLWLTISGWGADLYGSLKESKNPFLSLH